LPHRLASGFAAVAIPPRIGNKKDVSSARHLRPADERLAVALVTGACSGIGRAFAVRLGSLGYRLVLVSNRPSELAATAEEIRAAHGAVVHTISADLARPEAAEEIDREVRGRGLAVDILISNAGIFFFGEAVDAAPERANALLQLHVVTPSLLCARFGRDMRERGRGHILVVSSISAWRDFPGISYYGASKKYLRGFARALRSELSVYGVKVTCLAPGPTATGLYDTRTVPVERAKRLGIMKDPAVVADAGLRAMFAGRAECIPGWLARAMVWLSVLVPQWAIDLLRRRAPWLPKRKGAP
jgi:short-subunit dehydrogenase